MTLSSQNTSMISKLAQKTCETCDSTNDAYEFACTMSLYITDAFKKALEENHLDSKTTSRVKKEYLKAIRKVLEVGIEGLSENP